MRGLVAGGIVVALCGTAAAQDEFPPVTDRNFTLDLYQGPVLGSGKIIGMGGAHAAIAEGAAGITANPASAGVRSATSTGRWDWDWSLDWLNPEVGTDFDNNGTVIEADGNGVVLNPAFFGTAGIVVYYGRWGFGLNGSVQEFDIDSGADEYQLSALVAHLAIARSFWDRQLVASIGVRSGTFSLFREIDDEPTQELIEIAGSALETGVVWMPRTLDIRAGASAARATGTDAETGDCDPLDCEGFILPEAVEVPWVVSAGFAWRRAGSRWNRRVSEHFRDERALVLAADAVVTGPVRNGYGIEEYVVNSALQPSGRSTDLSIRVGADYEWKPGRLRVRGGAYYEPARFEGDNLSGRMHLTAGFDVRIYSFHFWGKPRRLRLSLTADGADKYGNGALSIGFWH